MRFLRRKPKPAPLPEPLFVVREGPWGVLVEDPKGRWPDAVIAIQDTFNLTTKDLVVFMEVLGLEAKPMAVQLNELVQMLRYDLEGLMVGRVTRARVAELLTEYFPDPVPMAPDE